MCVAVPQAGEHRSYFGELVIVLSRGRAVSRPGVCDHGPVEHDCAIVDGLAPPRYKHVSNNVVDHRVMLVNSLLWADFARDAETGPLYINPVIYSGVSIRFSTIDALEDALPQEDYRREPIPCLWVPDIRPSCVFNGF